VDFQNILGGDVVIQGNRKKMGAPAKSLISPRFRKTQTQDIPRVGENKEKLGRREPVQNNGSRERCSKKKGREERLGRFLAATRGTEEENGGDSSTPSKKNIGWAAKIVLKIKKKGPMGQTGTIEKAY